MSEASSESVNVAVVGGVLSSEPRRRELASGTVMINYEVTTEQGGERTSVPVVWIDPVRPPALSAGDEVMAIGLVRRRFFRAGGFTQSRTEVAASLVVRQASPRAAKAIEAAVAELQY